MEHHLPRRCFNRPRIASDCERPASMEVCVVIGQNGGMSSFSGSVDAASG